MPTESREQTDEIAISSLVKFGMYLQSNCLKEMNAFFLNNRRFFNKNIDEEQIILVVKGIIKYEKERLIELFQANIDSLDEKSITDNFNAIRSLKNKLTSKIPAFTT